MKLDNELDVEDLKALVAKFKMAVKAQTGKDFPTSAYEQLWGAICAVFDSWMNERAILYRKMEGIPAEWGTAVSVQAMVFGNTAILPLPVYVSLVMPVTEKTSSTVNT